MIHAYYNENDPFAAQWLRNLIVSGHIPAGDVDDRDIQEVTPDDLKGYTQCHFFAGIGGWPYALKLAGWPDDRPVWTGSCPCQPLSSAGQRKGHADQRHLWPAFQSLIAQSSPTVVFGEQVESKDGREWFAAVRADLEATGYACGCADLCAASAGAPHIRQRLFWVAQSAGEHGRTGTGGSDWAKAVNGGSDRGLADANTSGERDARELLEKEKGISGTWQQDGDCLIGPEHGSAIDRLADSESAGGREDAGTIRGGQVKRIRSAKGEISGWSERETGRTGDSSATDGRARNGPSPSSSWSLAPVWVGHSASSGQQGVNQYRDRAEESSSGNSESIRPSEDGGLGDSEVGRVGTLDGESGSSAQQQVEDRGPGVSDGLGDADEQGSQRRRSGPLEHAGQCTPWSSSELIGCADGKTRITGKRIRWMVDGLSGIMADTRTNKEKMNAKTPTARSSQVLPIMRQGHDATEVQEGSIRGQVGISQAGVLRPSVHGQRARGCDQKSHTSQLPSPVGENSQVKVPHLRSNEELARSSCGRESDEQFAVEPSDIVRFLSQTLASPSWERELEAAGCVPYLRPAAEGLGFMLKTLPAFSEIWRSLPDEAKHIIGVRLCQDARWCAISPLTKDEVARVGRLRAYGNAIVPPLASIFIQCAMEALDKERDAPLFADVKVVD